MISGKSESKTLTKDQQCNSDKCLYECKRHHLYEKDDIWNPAICSCKNGKYLESIMDDSAITCGEVIEKTKIVPTNFNEKICKNNNQQNTKFLYFTCLFINYHTLLVTVSIYCYLVKYRAKQKNYYHFTTQITN